MTAAVVLLSGGQDSTTCLYWAKQRFDQVHGLTVYYGQRHSTEVAAARHIAKQAGCSTHKVLRLEALQDIGDSALVDSGAELTQDGGYADDHAQAGLPSSYVPGRNLMFLGLAASYAVKVGARDIVAGVCQTDYSGYPDCRRVFVDAMEHAATMAMPSSCGPIKVHTPLMLLTKAQTVDMAHQMPGCWEALGASVTCYQGTVPPCGECPACQLRAQGFEEAGYDDPALESR